MAKLKVVDPCEAKKPTRPVGRPTKYAGWMCARAIELMREGYSLCEVAADLNISRDTLFDWKKNNKDFSDAIKTGGELSQAWWEGKGRLNLDNKDFSAALWFINMKNRFKHDWRDKHEVEVSGDMTVNIVRFTEPPIDSTRED